MWAHDERRVPVPAIGRTARASTSTGTSALRTAAATSGCCRICRTTAATTSRCTPALVVLSHNLLWIGTNAGSPSLANVEAGQATVLRLGVDDVLVFRVAARLEAVTTSDDEPVAVANTPGIRRTRGAAHREVVLRAAAHSIERLRVIRRDAVVLRDRQVGEESPARTVV